MSTFYVIHRQVHHSLVDACERHCGCCRAARLLNVVYVPESTARPFISAAAGRLSLSLSSVSPLPSFSRVPTSLSLSLFVPLWRKVRKRRVAGIVKCTERANACTSPIPHDVRIAPVFISHATNVNAKRLLTPCRNNS